jgi:cyclase
MRVGQEGFERGIPPLELAAELDFGEFASWHDRERIVPNLHRVYSELRGEPRGTPLDYLQMFAEMLAFNGGKPLRCLA